MNGGTEMVAQRVHGLPLGCENPVEIVGAYKNAWVRTWLKDEFHVNPEA